MTQSDAAAPQRASILVVEDDARTVELVALDLSHAGKGVATEQRVGSDSGSRWRTG